MSLVYEPSATLAASIGAAGTSETERFVADRCIALGITNIRTIKRAAQFGKSVEPKLASFDPEVLRSAIRSLVLFCWCRDQPEEAPPLDYVENEMRDLFEVGWTSATETDGDKPKEKAAPSRWAAKLQAYGYMRTDDLDLALIEAVRKGYFDDEKLAREARTHSGEVRQRTAPKGLWKMLGERSMTRTREQPRRYFGRHPRRTAEEH